MSKVIKVEQQTYDKLDRLRVGRQTFSDVVEELLVGRETILKAMDMLEGGLRFREWQREQLEKIKTPQ